MSADRQNFASGLASRVHRKRLVKKTDKVDTDRPGNTTNWRQNREFTENELRCLFACTF